MIPRLGDGNNAAACYQMIDLSLENDSPSRGRKRCKCVDNNFTSSLENDSPSRGRKLLQVSSITATRIMFRK